MNGFMATFLFFINQNGFAGCIFLDKLRPNYC